MFFLMCFMKSTTKILISYQCLTVFSTAVNYTENQTYIAFTVVFKPIISKNNILNDNTDY